MSPDLLAFVLATAATLATPAAAAPAGPVPGPVVTAQAIPSLPAPADRSVAAEIETATRSFQQQGGALPVIRRPSGLVFPFGHGAAPTLRCAPLRVCVIELEAGEILLNTVLGDSDRWLVETASTGSDGKTPLLVVKPTGCDLTTNLIASTDRRVYELLLTAPACRSDQLASLNPELPYTTLVRFYYPDDLVRTWNAGDQLAARRRSADAAELTPVASEPTDLNFRYAVSGRRFPWRPDQVFDDGRHTFIKLPKSSARFAAPLLFVLDQEGHAALLNYTERRGYLVADRVVERALLVLGDRKERRELRITNLALVENLP